MKKIIYKKILVTHDGSKLASLALPYAASLAQGFNSEILLLRVIKPEETETISITPVGFGIYPIRSGLVENYAKEEKRKARYSLERIALRLESEGVEKIHTIIEEGMAENVIINVAKTENCDLIVMASHGTSGLERALLGSVADFVIRYASCPVLVVNNEKGGE